MRCSPFYDACKWRAKPFALIPSQILPRRERFTAAARKALQSRDALEGQLRSQLDYLRADRREIRLEGLHSRICIRMGRRTMEAADPCAFLRPPATLPHGRSAQLTSAWSPCWKIRLSDATSPDDVLKSVDKVKKAGRKAVLVRLENCKGGLSTGDTALMSLRLAGQESGGRAARRHRPTRQPTRRVRPGGLPLTAEIDPHLPSPICMCFGTPWSSAPQSPLRSGIVLTMAIAVGLRSPHAGSGRRPHLRVGRYGRSKCCPPTALPAHRSPAPCRYHQA
jgi:hypothetical protein